MGQDDGVEIPLEGGDRREEIVRKLGLAGLGERYGRKHGEKR